MIMAAMLLVFTFANAQNEIDELNLPDSLVYHEKKTSSKKEKIKKDNLNKNSNKNQNPKQEQEACISKPFQNDPIEYIEVLFSGALVIDQDFSLTQRMIKSNKLYIERVPIDENFANNLKTTFAQILELKKLKYADFEQLGNKLILCKLTDDLTDLRKRVNEFNQRFAIEIKKIDREIAERKK